jgi:hypothetical protein
MNKKSWGKNEVYDAAETERFVAKRVETHADKSFQPSCLHKGAFKFMIPIRFENGLTVGECKCYYDFIEAQSSLSRRIRSIRRLTVDPLAKLVDGKPPSCLRRGKRPRNVEPPLLQRSASFSNLPSDNSLMTEVLQAFAMKDMPAAPKVGFHDYVLVTHIASHKDYPEDVHQAIWMSKDELSVSMRQAMIAENRERSERDILALLEDSLSDFQVLSSADDSMEEEGSMDLADLMTSICGTDKENPNSETALFQHVF